MFLQGGRDYQSTTADLDIWKEALSSRKNTTFKLYPDLNHLFMEGVGKGPPAPSMRSRDSCPKRS